MTHRMTVSHPVCARGVVLGLAVLLAGAFAAPARAGLPDRIVRVARGELAKNVHEIPNGSNEAPAIRRYRTAVRWSSPRTAWCGYFVSYVASQAGAPLGDHGDGIGGVVDIRRWAKRTKRWRAAPHPGNIAVFRGHVGIVERVVGSHWIVTIEGNHSNRVARVWHSRSEPRGYVQLSPPKQAPAPADDNSPVDGSADDPSSASSADDAPVDDIPADEVPVDDTLPADDAGA
jgi:hypothetical protein